MLPRRKLNPFEGQTGVGAWRSRSMRATANCQSRFVGNRSWDCVRFQVPAGRAPERCNWNELILLHLETRPHPEARLRFAWTPVLQQVTTICDIGHVANLHVRVTPHALDPFIHVRLFPQVVRPDERTRLHTEEIVARC